MTTKVYGSSDDLIEFEGDVSGEVCDPCTNKRDRGALLKFSDGTLLEVKYGRLFFGVWTILLLQRGPLFSGIVTCNKSDGASYSDVAHFKDGLKWAKATSDWRPISTEWEDVS